MPLAGIVTLIGVGLVVAALAIYLITVAGLLTSVSSKLTTIIDRIWAISSTAEPLSGAISEVNRDLEQARQAMDSLINRQQQRAGGQQARPPGQGSQARRGAGRKSTARRPGRKATSRA